jgi:hypothetical protein
MRVNGQPEWRLWASPSRAFHWVTADLRCCGAWLSDQREDTMNGDDLERRIERLRADAKALSKLTLLWRHNPDITATTAEDCAKNARDPLRRLKPLRRRGDGVPVPSPTSIH